jgi:hypothetical protein
LFSFVLLFLLCILRLFFLFLLFVVQSASYRRLWGQSKASWIFVSRFKSKRVLSWLVQLFILVLEISFHVALLIIDLFLCWPNLWTFGGGVGRGLTIYFCQIECLILMCFVFIWNHDGIVILLKLRSVAFAISMIAHCDSAKLTDTLICGNFWEQILFLFPRIYRVMFLYEICDWRLWLSLIHVASFRFHLVRKSLWANHQFNP